jgi:hypothetical protein
VLATTRPVQGRRDRSWLRLLPVDAGLPVLIPCTAAADAVVVFQLTVAPGFVCCAHGVLEFVACAALISVLRWNANFPSVFRGGRSRALGSLRRGGRSCPCRRHCGRWCRRCGQQRRSQEGGRRRQLCRCLVGPGPASCDQGEDKHGQNSAASKLAHDQHLRSGSYGWCLSGVVARDWCRTTIPGVTMSVRGRWPRGHLREWLRAWTEFLMAHGELGASSKDWRLASRSRQGRSRTRRPNSLSRVQRRKRAISPPPGDRRQRGRRHHRGRASSSRTAPSSRTLGPASRNWTATTSSARREMAPHPTRPPPPRCGTAMPSRGTGVMPGVGVSRSPPSGDRPYPGRSVGVDRRAAAGAGGGRVLLGEPSALGADPAQPAGRIAALGGGRRRLTGRGSGHASGNVVGSVDDSSAAIRAAGIGRPRWKP